MTKILILGADGMLGHQITASMRHRFDVHGTVRNEKQRYAHLTAFLPPTTYFGIDARNAHAVEEVLVSVRPEVVINAIGIVKQRKEGSNAVESIEINALLPHRLAVTAGMIGARLI